MACKRTTEENDFLGFNSVEQRLKDEQVKSVSSMRSQAEAQIRSPIAVDMGNRQQNAMNRDTSDALNNPCGQKEPGLAPPTEYWPLMQ